MLPSITFTEDSYKECLITLLKRSRQSKGLSQSQLADLLRIQKSYLSRVLRGDAHLSDDQLYSALAALEVTSDQWEFIELLHRRDRSGLSNRKKLLNQKIETFRENFQQAAQVLKNKARLDDQREFPTPSNNHNNNIDSILEYYTSPLPSKLHMRLKIDRFRKEPKLLCKELGITESVMRATLTLLNKLGIIKILASGEVLVEKSFLSLGSSSPLHLSYQSILRNESIRDIYKQEKASMHYGARIVADGRFRNWLKNRFLEILREAEMQVEGAPNENCFILCFDLFEE